MCCHLAHTINGCKTTGEIQELFGIRNDVIGQSTRIAETKYHCNRNSYMYQDVSGSFTLSGELKSHSQRNTAWNICKDSADIKSHRSAWHPAAINIKGGASNYHGQTAVSISNNAGEQRVVWKRKLDHASQEIVARMIDDRPPPARFPMEILQLTFSMVRLAQRSS
jgi:hypothetical protein